MQRDDWVDTSYRQADYQPPAPGDLSRLPSAVRRLSCGPRNTFPSDIGLADNTAWDQSGTSGSSESSGVDDDIKEGTEAAREWGKPPPSPQRARMPSATRRLGRTPVASPDERNAAYSSDEESRSYWTDEEGPPMPAQFWSATRQRQQLLMAASPVVEESPPWWWYPCYHSDPETPWYDPKVKFGGDSFWDPVLCADHIYIACKMAVTDAISNQEELFAKAWDTSLTNLREMFEDVDYDWMPKIAKRPEKPVDNNHYINSTFDREMIGCHNNLQIVSVPVDQIIRDQQRSNGDFLPIWFSVKTHLRQVLCDAECGLYHMNIPKRDVPRSVMPDSLRDLHGFDQQLRDWIIFRDYKNIMQFYEHIFLRHAFYQ
ncbi:uncharacterized protein LOC126267079 [Schistocerca gregaria]|uniref:uncharacterized protein LOC126267079 n=1 Tax=Schistocerca gregaria TaxID=7010 RepID=UPI00211E8465|nr:uncharacterized protein LOC126267079 [Schistocerca gregaria]